MSVWGKRLALALVAGLLLAALVYAFLPQPVAVDVASVTRGTLQVTVDEDGQTRIKERYIVSSPLAGRLMRITLDAGDSVKAGETVLTRIEPTDPELLDPRAQAQAEARVKAAQARLQQTRTELDKAEAAMQHAESELARVRKLYDRDAASDERLQEKLLQHRVKTEEFRAARFAEEIAQFELELARAALLRTRPEDDGADEDSQFKIRAPITGRVLRVIQESSTIVSPGAQLLEVGDPSDLEIVVDVLSQDAVRIDPGDKVLLEDWGGEKPLEGTVRLIEPSGFTKVSALGVEEQRVNVVVDFDDSPDGRDGLGDGFRVEARIVVWEGTDVLTVPLGALFRREGEWALFVVENGRAALRHVTIGHRGDFEAEVTEGLTEDTPVIVHPSDRVSDGVRVRPR